MRLLQFLLGVYVVSIPIAAWFAASDLWNLIIRDPRAQDDDPGEVFLWCIQQGLLAGLFWPLWLLTTHWSSANWTRIGNTVFKSPFTPSNKVIFHDREEPVHPSTKECRDATTTRGDVSSG